MSEPDSGASRKDADMRTVVRAGDPGIDGRWLRRRTLGIVVACGWLVVGILAIGVMAASRTGPPGWIEAWQLRDQGTANPLLAMLPFIPLIFLPRLAGWLPADIRHPFLLGMQQAWKPAMGPRVEWPADRLRHRMTSIYRGALVILLLGSVALAAGVAWAWTEASRPLRAPARVSYDDVAAGRAPDGLAMVIDAREGQARWIESTQLRTSTVRDEWRDLRPDGPNAPTALVEQIAVDVDANGRVSEVARPGLIGRLSRLDDWHANLLRREGFALADQAWVLKRSISADTDGMDDADAGIILGLAGLVATFLGGTVALAAHGRLAGLAPPSRSARKHRP